MAERQQALADAILKDPDVVSLSSFIGVDGQNLTLNTGRFLINLKPKDERNRNATEITRRIQPGNRRCRRHHAVSAAGAGPDCRFLDQPHAVPVRAGEPEPRRVPDLGAETGGTARAVAGARQRRQRSGCIRG